MLHLGRIIRAGIQAIDAVFRWVNQVEEFTDDPACVLRLALGKAHQEVILSDSTKIQHGEIIGELHFWNEHMPTMDLSGPDLGWGLSFYRQIRHSLAALATYVSQNPRYRRVRAFRGDTIAVPMAKPDVPIRLGFDVIEPPPGSPWRRFTVFCQDVYAWWLVWTYNRGSLRGKRFRQVQRSELWISRDTLLKRYGSGTITANEKAAST